MLVFYCLSWIKCLMTSTSRRNKCGIIWLGHSYVRQWTKARSGGATMGCLASELHLGEALTQGVSLAVGFGSSDFTISYMAMHPAPGQEKHKLHISCCLLGDAHQCPQHTCNSASCFPCPTSWGFIQRSGGATPAKWFWMFTQTMLPIAAESKIFNELCCKVTRVYN